MAEPALKVDVDLVAGAGTANDYILRHRPPPEWPDRQCFPGWYIPDAEPRPIPGAALTPVPEIPIIHRSVLDRMATDPFYRPIDLPAAYSIDERPFPPAADAGPGPAGPQADPPPADLPRPDPTLPG